MLIIYERNEIKNKVLRRRAASPQSIILHAHDTISCWRAFFIRFVYLSLFVSVCISLFPIMSFSPFTSYRLIEHKSSYSFVRVIIDSMGNMFCVSECVCDWNTVYYNFICLCLACCCCCCRCCCE